MGIITLSINAPVSVPYTIDSDIETDCYSEKIITVKYNGANKFVSIQSSGAVFPPVLFSETITADKTYTLYIEGNNVLNQNFTASITMVIQELTATGLVTARVRLDRDHSNQFC